ncbi:hypothetical protein ABZ470_31740 [Streptosporangium sp. NPDC020072]|uniref:hypothetical protein n=1 Tax=Streptosporangium sp. NPDC020072 TaxID=3154788 RepID=UPI003428D0D7
MAEVSYPWDSGTGSVITEQQWSSMSGIWQDNGIVADGPSSMALKVTTLSEPGVIYVETGEAHMVGFHYELNAQLPIAVPANSNGANSRIDLVVLRMNRDTNQIRVAYITGVPASSPVAPALTTTGGIYEMALAQIQMGPNATQVPAAEPQLVDKRSFVGKRIRVTEDSTMVPVGSIYYQPSTDKFYGKASGSPQELGGTPDLSGYALVGHNHDSAYSPLGHTHPEPPLLGVRLRRFSTVSGASGSANVISWQGSDGFWTPDMWSALGTPTRINITTAGVYFVSALVEWAGSATAGYRTGLIRHSTGGVLIEDNKAAISTEPVRCNPVAVFYAASGTYFTIEGWQGTGGALNINSANVSVTRLWGVPTT